VRDVSRFSLPAGISAGIGVVASYLFSRHTLDASLTEARTVATSVLIVVGLFLIAALESSRGLRRRAAVLVLGLGLAGAYALVLSLSFAREFFALAAPGPALIATVAGGVALALAAFRLRPNR
jgi:hypothetical protein